MNTKKIVSVITATSFVALSFSGCSLLGGKDKAAIEEVASSYIDNVLDGKINKTAQFVVDEEDFFQENELPSQQQALISAVFDASSYEVEDIEVSKDSASAQIVFTMPDLDSIADEGYSFDEFIDAIGDIDEDTEETVEFEFSKDGEDWLIEGDSTEDFYNFLMSIGEDIEFSGLSEGGALDAVDEFYGYLVAGNMEAAIGMTANSEGGFEEFSEMLAEHPEYGALVDCVSNYFSAVEYTSEVTNVTDDEITVTVTGTAPDAETMVTEAMNDHTILVPIMADFIESMISGDYDVNIIYTGLFGAVADTIGTGSPIPYSTDIAVTVDDDGNYYVEPGDGFLFDFDFPEVAGSEELIPEAMDLLLSQGRISQEQYNEFMAQSGYSSGGEGYDVVINFLEQGDDFFSYDYDVTDSMITFYVQTWDYYDEGDVFDYSVSLDGADGFITGEYVMPEDSCDMIEIRIPVVTGSAAGNYEITVYDEGNSTSVLADIEMVIMGEGAPITGDAPAFGQSMSYGNEGDDLFSFHFTDGNGNWVSSGTYSSNRGAIDFYVITWDYYDVGSTVVADVYYEGDLVGSVTGVNSSGGTDTFEFTYEPTRLPDGDYVFRLYDVEGNGILCDAYCTVETD